MNDLQNAFKKLDESLDYIFDARDTMEMTKQAKAVNGAYLPAREAVDCLQHALMHAQEAVRIIDDAMCNLEGTKQ